MDYGGRIDDRWKFESVFVAKSDLFRLLFLDTLANAIIILIVIDTSPKESYTTPTVMVQDKLDNALRFFLFQSNNSINRPMLLGKGVNIPNLLGYGVLVQSWKLFTKQPMQAVKLQTKNTSYTHSISYTN